MVRGIWRMAAPLDMGCDRRWWDRCGRYVDGARSTGKPWRHASDLTGHDVLVARHGVVSPRRHSAWSDRIWCGDANRRGVGARCKRGSGRTLGIANLAASLVGLGVFGRL